MATAEKAVETGGQVMKEVLKKQGLIGLLLLLLLVQDFVSDYLQDAGNAKLIDTFCERLETKIEETSEFEERTDYTHDKQNILLEKLSVGQERQNMLLERLLDRLDVNGGLQHPTGSD